jgi:transposase
MVPYSDEFRDRMVERMLGGITATALGQEVNVPQPTLSKWLKNAALRSERGREQAMKRSTPTRAAKASKFKAPTPAARRPSEWTPEEKFAAVLEAAGVSNEHLGEWLRRNGLREADLVAFREEVREAAVGGMSARRSASPDAKRVKELERELKRKEAALAETAALLVLRKKAVALWGEEGDDT